MAANSGFSILVRIDLLLGPAAVLSSAWFWVFQYPRADRLIVGSTDETARLLNVSCFSILVRIDLLLG